MRIRCVACAVVVAVACAGAAKRPTVAIPTTAPGTTQPAATETIPPSDLQSIFRSELGAAYDPIQASGLNQAHQLLEDYFAAHSSSDRKRLAGKLQATGIGAEVLGRLCRVCAHWPAMPGGGIFYVNSRSGPNDVRYFLGVPEKYDRNLAWPMVVRLPDPKPLLSDPRPDAAAVSSIYAGWIRAELKLHPDSLVLMPVQDLDELFGTTYTGMNGIMGPVLDAAERANIDPARLYMSGHSLACGPTWNLALHYPTYFAAINPMGGAVFTDWQRLRLMNLRNVLPVVWHDAGDPVIPENFSRSIVSSLRELKIEVDFDEPRGSSHVPDDEAQASEYQKMRARTRSLYPDTVWLATNRPDVRLNRNDWIQIYQELDPGKEHHHYFTHGTGHLTVYDKQCSVKARISNNVIEASADNVEALRFYLNDQLANLDEPVTVRINGKVKFKGIVKSSVEEMLRDQLFLGRGWRYYTAAIDITASPPATQPATKPATRQSEAAKTNPTSQPAHLNSPK